MKTLIRFAASLALLTGCVGPEFTSATTADPIVAEVAGDAASRNPGSGPVLDDDAGVAVAAELPDAAPLALDAAPPAPDAAADVALERDAGPPPAHDACVLVDKVKTCEGSCNANFDDGCGQVFTCPPCSAPNPTPSMCVVSACGSCVYGTPCCGATTATGCGCAVAGTLCE